ncbi:MAG: phenylacetate--CoA ligase family protein [Chloroflexi bacterium]|nr:phenylacetate--CoA ligase family protein [Chloroflexota bacterium]MDA8237951.1 phenylacetate--CoA ligase family protein [Chloroflexota bacterium]
MSDRPLQPDPETYRRRPLRSWLRLALDTRRAARERPAAIAARQDARLRGIIEHARAHSPFYRARWASLPDAPHLDELPPVSKPELMARFDDWLTDPRVRLRDVEAFISDPGRVGELFAGEFSAWTTSGTTGQPGVFVHDRVARGVYDALMVTRTHALTEGAFLRALGKGLRIATVVATGGHHVSTSLVNVNRRRFPALARRIRIFSVLTPLPRLVAELNAFDPAILIGYPTALDLLAQEAGRGHLRGRPALVVVGGEVLTADARGTIERALGAHLLDLYAAGEFPGIAFSCRFGRLHANSDWVILEPVERDVSPTPPDRASHTVLLTNLANRVQPIVRYDLGDSLTVSSASCACGSPFPVIEVGGRRGDVLRFRGVDGREIRVLPLALGTVVEKTPGVRRFQAYQTGDGELRVRIEPDDEADREATWARVADRVDGYLASQGIAGVGVVRDEAPPARDRRSQKFRSVWDARHRPDVPASPTGGKP